MESPKGRTSPLMVSSPFASPNIGLLLRRRILEWTQDTETEPLICIHVCGKIFQLHKDPLVAKCGYFNKSLQNSSEVQKFDNFPGGSESFELAILFTYNYPLSLDPFNVPTLRCAADFLEMTEEFHPSNLIERCDLYLNQVVLQNWDDTLIVLQKCVPLVPVSEELLIVSRCVESLAFMACMEILDPERRNETYEVIPLQRVTGRNWNCGIVKGIAGRDLWIRDLIALPFEFFKRIIGALRRQGMKEKYVGPVIMFYANKWILSKKTLEYWEETSKENGIEDAKIRVSAILEGVIDLILVREKVGSTVPVAFYFALLSRSLSLKLSVEYKTKLDEIIVSVLHLARVDDFLFGSNQEVETMEKIVKKYILINGEKEFNLKTPSCDLSVVADLWDEYLMQIAKENILKFERFVQLIEIIPSINRESHDNLYGAITTLLLENPNLSNEEKASLCNHLTCQKLSHQTCIQAVQNDQMPIRLIVQALFIQQLHTHQTLKDCTDSFRYTTELTGTGTFTPKSTSPYGKGPICPPSSSLSNRDYESASFRIQALEKEIVTLKQSLRCKNDQGEVKACRVSGRNPFGQVRGCIGFNSISQRKCGSRILKIFKRIGLLGKGKRKR
ncbi:hypothetical protein LUZ60_006364 [Juncus effusus]|nr:hypothetical protein LUZ60_006364 [Juncus effusus]